MRVDDSAGRLEPDGEAAEPSGRRQVSIHERRRDRQHVGNIVEPPLVGIVGREERGDIDIEREQIADRVLVLGAIQTVEGFGAAGIRTRRRCSIDLGGEPRHHGVRGRPIGSGASCRRHRAGPEPGDDLFPHFGVRPRAVDVGGIEQQPCGANPVVVTGGAVGIEKLTRPERSGSAGLLRGRGRGETRARPPPQERAPQGPVCCATPGILHVGRARSTKIPPSGWTSRSSAAGGAGRRRLPIVPAKNRPARRTRTTRPSRIACTRSRFGPKLLFCACTVAVFVRLKMPSSGRIRSVR